MVSKDYLGATSTYLFSQLVLDVSLHAAQHERLENHMKPTQLMLIEPSSTRPSSSFNILREPFRELVMRVEQTRHDEMKQGPELYG
jgi:hypothetical protein